MWGGRAKENYLGQMGLPDRGTRRSCYLEKKQSGIYYHLGRDRAFNETLLKRGS